MTLMDTVEYIAYLIDAQVSGYKKNCAVTVDKNRSDNLEETYTTIRFRTGIKSCGQVVIEQNDNLPILLVIWLIDRDERRTRIEFNADNDIPEAIFEFVERSFADVWSGL